MLHSAGTQPGVVVGGPILAALTRQRQEEARELGIKLGWEGAGGGAARAARAARLLRVARRPGQARGARRPPPPPLSRLPLCSIRHPPRNTRCLRARFLCPPPPPRLRAAVRPRGPATRPHPAGPSTRAPNAALASTSANRQASRKSSSSRIQPPTLPTPKRIPPRTLPPHRPSAGRALWQVLGYALTRPLRQTVDNLVPRLSACGAQSSFLHALTLRPWQTITTIKRRGLSCPPASSASPMPNQTCMRPGRWGG